MLRFQPPPRQTHRAVFPQWAFLLSSHKSLWCLSAGSAFGSIVPNPVVIIETEVLIEPHPTPPVPAKTPPVPRPHEMPPHFLLYPVLDIGEAYARIPYPELVNPAPELRIDQVDDPVDRL